MSENKAAPSAVVPEPPRIKFEKEDFEVMNLVLNTQPELKICTLALKTARQQKASYPLKDAGQIKALLGNEKILTIEGHQISAATIEKYLIKEDFPIENEEELVARVHIALWRCKEDVIQALRAPKDAASIIKSITLNS